MFNSETLNQNTTSGSDLSCKTDFVSKAARAFDPQIILSPLCQSVLFQSAVRNLEWF